MNISELEIKRQEKVDAMTSLVNLRGENMDAEALAAIKSFKDEIEKVDLQIAGINELRSVAIKDARPAEVKKVDEKAELRTAFGEMLRGKIDGRTYEKRANTVGANGDVVPEDFLKELQETILEYGMLNSSARHITTEDSGTLSIPLINDTANKGEWTAEGSTISPLDFTTSTVQMNAYKVMTGIQVSNELIEDSFFDLESYVSNALGVRISRAIETAIVSGAGAASPEGILINTGTKVATSAAIGVVDSVDLLTAIYALQPSSRTGAVIYVADGLMKDLSLETDSTGRPLLQTQAGATPADPVMTTLGGYPIVVNYELADVATASESAFIGNMSNYMIRDVRGITVKRDDYSGMNSDMVSFYATARLDGKVISANDAFVKIVTA